jgi:hypothetical protein
MILKRKDTLKLPSHLFLLTYLFSSLMNFLLTSHFLTPFSPPLLSFTLWYSEAFPQFYIYIYRTRIKYLQFSNLFESDFPSGRNKIHFRVTSNDLRKKVLVMQGEI